ncbi:MAG: cation transporter [Nitrospirae bacterium]|nr:cation transporter [Candidatus Manganitrophaceae bacterium]
MPINAKRAEWDSNLAQIKKMLCVILFLNFAMALAKSLWGYYSHSISMQADGIHSFLDGASNITGLIGLWFAADPPDEEHPYGHQKFETFAAFCISVFLFFGCYSVLKSSYGRLQDSVIAEVSWASFAIMIVTLAMNFFITRWEGREGRRLRSEILIADAAHTKSDIYVSLSVIGSLIAGKIGYPLLDPLIAVLIAGIIGKVGWGILLESSKVLTDVSRIDAKKIIALVINIPKVETCHAVRTRGSMNHVHVDLHIHVHPQMSIEAAHELAHEVEEKIMEIFSEVAEVIVHLEPHIPGLKND